MKQEDIKDHLERNPGCQIDKERGKGGNVISVN